MRWEHPLYLIFLIAIPLMGAVASVIAHRRKQRMSAFAETRFYDFFMQEFSAFHWGLRNVVFFLALVFLIIALAQPQWNKEVQIMKKEGIDIVVCVDVSKSMDAQDIKPSRIDRAKDQISRFIDGLRGDRIAIVAFAGRSFVQCPLTDDYGAAKLFLSLLDTETVTSYGTDIGGALRTAMPLFSEAEKHKVIIVVSDGEDLEENALKVTEESVKQGAVIYTLGVGTPQGTTIPILDKQGNTVYAKDDDGNIVFTKLDVSTLTDIARKGNGRFYPITPQQSEIFEILNTINQIEKKKFDSKEYLRYKEQYAWFAAIALLILCIEWLIVTRRKTTLRRTV
ncbi:MAG: VWA domain-containing protein [Candidatus Cloacimonetes bacterium]|nr:VWA domain-containing protein [Candidatus Cloacimonadota bacterium]